MTASVPDRLSAAPRAAILLPIAFLLHLAEEWFGGFSAWTLMVLGNEISPERFVVINASSFLFFVLGTLAAFHYPRLAWFAASLAALLGLNGALHTLATLGLGLLLPGHGHRVAGIRPSECGCTAVGSCPAVGACLRPRCPVRGPAAWPYNVGGFPLKLLNNRGLAGSPLCTNSHKQYEILYS